MCVCDFRISGFSDWLIADQTPGCKQTKGSGLRFLDYAPIFLTPGIRIARHGVPFTLFLVMGSLLT